MTTIEVTALGITWAVTGTYHKASMGRREQGVQLEPDEPAEFEIENIRVVGSGVDLYGVLSASVIEAIQDLADEEFRSED